MKICLFVLLILMSLSIKAHALGVGYLEVEVIKESGIIRNTLDINPMMLKNPSLLFHHTLGKSFWKTGSARCSWRNIKSSFLSHTQVRITADAECPEMKSKLNLDLAFLSQVPEGYKIMGRIKNDGQDSTFLAGKSERMLKITPVMDKPFSYYIYSGAKQVGVAHTILFLLTMVVTAGGALEIFKTLIGFSLGHTLSLLLATFGMMSVPQQLVDPAVAMSIIFLAAEGILRKKVVHRFWLVSFFGMIHGFSNAYGLNEQKLSFFNMMKAFIGFNMGLQIGVVLIIVMIVPIILFLKKYSNYHPQFMRGTSAVLLLVGCYWIVERTIL